MYLSHKPRSTARVIARGVGWTSAFLGLLGASITFTALGTGDLNRKVLEDILAKHLSFNSEQVEVIPEVKEPQLPLEEKIIVDKFSQVVGTITSDVGNNSLNAAYLARLLIDSTPEKVATLSTEVEVIDNLLKARLGFKFYQPGDQFEVVKSKEDNSKLHNILRFSFKRGDNVVSAVNVDGIFYDAQTGMPFLDKFLPAKGPQLISCLYQSKNNRSKGHRGMDIVGEEYDFKIKPYGKRHWKGNEESDIIIGSEIIYPYASGVVTDIGFSSIPNVGNYVIVRNDQKAKDGRNKFTLLWHLSSHHIEDGTPKFGPLLKRGERVKQGQVLGNYGNTGYSLGAHIHVGEVSSNINNMTVGLINKYGLRRKSGSKIEIFDPLNRLPSFNDVNPEVYAKYYAHREEVFEVAQKIAKEKSLPF